MDTLGQVVLSIIERLSSFGDNYVLLYYTVQVWCVRVCLYTVLSSASAPYTRVCMAINSYLSKRAIKNVQWRVVSGAQHIACKIFHLQFD